MTETTFGEQAVAASDTTFTPDELASVVAGGFSRILDGLEAQTAVQRNQAVPATAAATDRYVARTGFDSLLPGREFQYTRSTIGRGFARPSEVTQADPSPVDQVVLRSFGWSIDQAALRLGARSIRVDSLESGHNPYKIFARIQEATQQPHRAPSHLISRRGDIYSLVPWNRAPDCNLSQAARSKRVADRAISIELEAWHTGFYVPYSSATERTFRITGLMPYTDAQMQAVAFLLRKLGVWSNTDPTTCLGFTMSQIGARLGNGGSHQAGTVLESVFSSQTPQSPGGEWQFPPDWVLGDPLPGHLSDQSAAWTTRLQTYYTGQGVAAGTAISHYKTIKDIYDTLPVYDIETSLFEAQSAAAVYVADPGAPTASAPASAAADATGESFARSQRMQGSLRNQLYDAMSVANEATSTAVALQAMRANAMRTAKISIPVVRNALAFNFATGEWNIIVGTTTLNPNPSAVADALKAAAAAQAARGRPGT